MSPEVPTSVPVGYLIVAIAGLAAVAAALFWQLMAAKAETVKAKDETLQVAREVFPVVTQLLAITESLKRLVEELVRQRSGS